MKMEKWDEEKNLYDLAEVSVGNFVYIRKEHKGKKNNFPHYCANCFGSGNISIFHDQLPERILRYGELIVLTERVDGDLISTQSPFQQT